MLQDINTQGKRPHDILVSKRVMVVPAKSLELGSRIARGLLFYSGDLLAPIIGFGFDYTDGLFVNEEYVVSGADIGLVLLNGNAETRAKVDPLFFLNGPAGLGQ
jgi:hypothetical protein